MWGLSGDIIGGWGTREGGLVLDCIPKKWSWSTFVGVVVVHIWFTLLHTSFQLLEIHLERDSIEGESQWVGWRQGQYYVWRVLRTWRTLRRYTSAASILLLMQEYLNMHTFNLFRIFLKCLWNWGSVWGSLERLCEFSWKKEVRGSRIGEVKWNASISRKNSRLVSRSDWESIGLNPRRDLHLRSQSHQPLKRELWAQEKYFWMQEDLRYSVDQEMEYKALSQNHNKNHWEKGRMMVSSAALPRSSAGNSFACLLQRKSCYS